MRRGTHAHADSDFPNHVVRGKSTMSTDEAALAVLMDIRAELRSIADTLACQNFIEIPRTLRTISRKIPAVKK